MGSLWASTCLRRASRAAWGPSGLPRRARKTRVSCGPHAILRHRSVARSQASSAFRAKPTKFQPFPPERPKPCETPFPSGAPRGEGKNRFPLPSGHTRGRKDGNAHRFPKLSLPPPFFYLLLQTPDAILHLLDAFCAFLYNASQRSLSISFRQPPNFCAAGDAHLRCRLWTVLTWRIQFHDLSKVVPQCLHH